MNVHTELSYWPRAYDERGRNVAGQPIPDEFGNMSVVAPFTVDGDPRFATDPPVVYGPVATPTNVVQFPCQKAPEQWSYNMCYGGFYDGSSQVAQPCRFVSVVDMEDFLNNEKRKEKSRDAARCRRSRETEIFSELAACLPINKEETNQLDKTSIMRLAISYLRVRAAAPQILPAPEQCVTSDSMRDDENFLLQALGGFLIMISPEGDIAYVSSNVTEYLGITQVDLMGQSIFDFSHPCDHEEIKEAASMKLNPTRDTRSIFPRLKCTLTSKGRNLNIKSASYKVIHCTGHIILNKEIENADEQSESEAGTQPSAYFLAVARPIPHPSNIEIPLDSKTFLTKHNMKLKFTYVDDKMKELLGYDSEDLLDHSVFDCHHAGDAESLVSSFKCLISKGQSETPRYRFLCRFGGYAWVVTQSTVIYDKLMKPQSIVSVHYLISGIIDEDEIFSSAQLAASGTAASAVKIERQIKSSGDSNNNNSNSFIDSAPDLSLVSSLVDSTSDIPVSITAKIFDADSSLPLRTETATAKIFAPRTEEMNTGFLMFDEEVGKTVLKEEPEDLTHLAPTAGDACIPLQSPTGDAGSFLVADAFDEFILAADTDAYLLSHDDADNDLNCTSFDNEPFIDYRDNDNTEDCLFGNSSPSLSKSPCSLPSLCSPGKSPFAVDDGGGGSGGGADFEDPLNAFETLGMDCSIETGCEKVVPDLDIRAPYIPMNGIDDLPLLMSEDLMWGALPDHVDLHRDFQSRSYAQKGVTPVPVIPSVSPIPLELSEEASALAQLLCSVDDKKQIEFLDTSELFGPSTTDSVSSPYKKCCWSTKLDKVMDLQIEAALASPTFDLNTNANTMPGTRSRGGAKRPGQQAAQNTTKRVRHNERHSVRSQSKPNQLVLNGKLQQRTEQLTHLMKPELRTPSSGSELRIMNPHTSTTGMSVNPAPGAVKHQPSDSVLMNLLVSGCDARLAMRQVQAKSIMDRNNISAEAELQNNAKKKERLNRDFLGSYATNIGTNSIILNNKTANNIFTGQTTTQHSVMKTNQMKQSKGNLTSHTILEPIPSLLDLSQIDYDMNTPVGSSLLNGSELLTALDGTLLT